MASPGDPETHISTVTASRYSFSRSPPNSAGHTNKAFGNSHRRYYKDSNSLKPKRDAEASFEKRVANLQARSRTRFQNQWEAILEKYSQIDDEKESDEIDLSTGEIITDNGHLRALARKDVSSSSLDDIWSANLVEEPHQSRQYMTSKSGQNTFISPARQKDVSEIRRSSSMKDNVLLLSPSPTKKTRYSPSKTPSKTASPSRNTPPSKFTSPRLSSPRLSPSRLSSPQLSSPSANPNNSGFERITDSKSLFQPTRLFPTAKETPKREHNPFLERKEKTSKYTLCDLSTPTTDAVYHCAFHYCKFCTGNRFLYKEHLLKSHPKELKQIGYPVQTETETGVDTISSDTIENISKVFPLTFDKLLQSDSLLHCNMKLSPTERCRRVFFTLNDLKEHQNTSSGCDSRLFTFSCPILGCPFQTRSFEALQNHFRTYNINSSHLTKESRSISKKPLINEHSTKANDLPTNPKIALTKTEVMNEIDELFDSD
ncbi:hypothetical protein PGUG_00577 [Meyerozyma guilliermondii ATCC 6260]|uniref:C2H2-type domain-containing protein n=1 Tax=Meyerozyma guilliermondii (strain ATCC 6260 / CBS 566 / DSM 6381 / JCM 1539 / NBRC 10279 / NRRL Y-324) TaxID=294746 RepID=A5DBC2_PICGU|nr:uncharacterized protein PGUG_00577 [Meyerozyma guilliermondii ATCC 6260]EDK36479.2 hypothetical protein PGUG_00577 [Meyerozyma guilliermondii ATCC 6260]